MSEAMPVGPVENDEITGPTREGAADLTGNLLELPEEEADEPRWPPEHAEKDCERCGRRVWYADGTWWHVVSGTESCPDASQWLPYNIYP
jgi:hypothetical protein